MANKNAPMEKFDIDDFDFILGGQEIVTIKKIEWDRDVKIGATTKKGKIVSIGRKKAEIKGKMTFDQVEKLKIAEAWGSEDGTLAGISDKDLVGSDSHGRKVEITGITFGKDGYNIDDNPEKDQDAVDFVCAKAVIKSK